MGFFVGFFVVGLGTTVYGLLAGESVACPFTQLQYSLPNVAANGHSSALT